MHAEDFGTPMQVFAAAGFEPTAYQPDWRVPDPNVWAHGMVNAAQDITHKSKHGVVLAGFSAGGLTAVLATNELLQSTEVQVDGLVACSFSPWFGLDRVRQAHTFPNSALHTASEALKASLSKLTLPDISCRAQLYAGAQEMPTILEIRDQALRQWPHADAITMPCTHDIFHQSYLQALSCNVGRLAGSPTITSEDSLPSESAAV